MPPELRFDRPFIFAIRERSTGTLLFVGRVVDPAS
jgi:serine protease inhibitor